MHNDRKLTKDDTWRSADLRKHIKEREGDERKHRRGESAERRHRDPDKESRRERDKQKESTRERRDEDERNRYADRRKEGSRDRRSDKERVRREDRDGEKRERDKLLDEKMYRHDHKEERDRRRDSEGRREREKERDRHRDKQKEEEKDRKRGHEGDDDKRREERDKERRREARDREHAAERERRRPKDGGEGDKDRTERHEREKRERHRERERYKDEYEDKRIDEERRERHEERQRLEMRKERDHKEDHRRHREERERRHKERGYHDEKRKPDSDSGGHRGLRGPGEEVRHHLGGRERAERSEYKERTPKAVVEPERNHHRDGTQRSTSEKSRGHETKAEDIATVSAVSEHQAAGAVARGNKEEAVDGEAYEEYEDDFEDYEEDFEEMDESAKESEDEKEPRRTDEDEEREEPKSQRRKEIEAIQRAMDEENERVGTTQPRQYRSREEEDAPKSSRESERNQSRSSQRGKFIDFVAAKQREVSKQAATKQKKRSEELLRLIDLDFSMTFSILDLPPVNEYDMYIRNFGAANTKQAYVQCNEDNADRDIQTEEIEMCEKWTQHPPECGGACGDPNLSQEARDKSASETSFDSQRLAAFLRSASQVMVVLLEEEQAEKKSLRKMRSEAHTLSFSDGSLQLNTKLPFLYGRSVSLVHFSQVQRYTMMSVHSPTARPSAVRLDSCTIICIWNIWEPSRPQKVLTYESEVQCCCFSPGKATLVFAGTAVGSVLLWDLREQASIHYRLKIGQDEWTFRQPTFSTDAVMASSGHQSSVMSLEVVPSVAGGQELEAPLLASEEESSGLSFQLASLDETGVLNFWVVVELPKPNESGSPTDLGLRPGGKVKLLHSSSLLAAERSLRNAKTVTLQSLHLKFLPTDSNHFFIGTNMGLVNHGTSHGLKAPPKFYRCREAGVRPVEVSSIHFSPFVPQLFLVGCVDGSIRLHAVSYEQPVAEWKNGAEVVSVQWSQTRATVFCVLDAASNLHVWDLSKSDTEPVITETVNPDRVTAMALFGDPGQHNTYSGVALAHESGTIDIQYFSKHLASPSATDAEKLEIMMTEAS